MAKVLIVDDEPTILKLFEYFFTEAGHQVTLAADGRAALDTLRDSIPDFIILDIAMPVMSGPQFAVELKRMGEEDPNLSCIPFVVMTGENFMESGVNDVFSETPGFLCFFPKMTPPQKVLEKAEEVLNRPAA